MTQATHPTPRDTRPTVAGIPWDVVVQDDTGFLHVIDVDGAHVAIVDCNDSFVLGLIADVSAQGARIAALEAALAQVVTRFSMTARCHVGYAIANIEACAILRDLGLAHRLEGNQSQAEQVTA